MDKRTFTYGNAPGLRAHFEFVLGFSNSFFFLAVFFSGEPNPPKLEAKPLSTGNEMKVYWIKQDDGGSPIKHYLVRYRAVSMIGHKGTYLTCPVIRIIYTAIAFR